MNPWDDVEREFAKYISAVTESYRAYVSYLSAAAHVDLFGEFCKRAKAKSEAADAVQRDAYGNHVAAVAKAVKSGIPCPW